MKKRRISRPRKLRTDRSELGRVIRALRTAAKIETQKQLADLLGVGASAVSMWESGETSPSRDNMRAIAAACSGRNGLGEPETLVSQLMAVAK